MCRAENHKYTKNVIDKICYTFKCKQCVCYLFEKTGRYVSNEINSQESNGIYTGTAHGTDPKGSR